MLYVVDFAPDARLGGTPHPPGTREYFTCLEGLVEIIVAGQPHDLNAGDVLAFPGNTPHSYHNPIHDTQTKRLRHPNFFQHECYLELPA